MHVGAHSSTSVNVLTDLSVYLYKYIPIFLRISKCSAYYPMPINAHNITKHKWLCTKKNIYKQTYAWLRRNCSQGVFAVNSRVSLQKRFLPWAYYIQGNSGFLFIIWFTNSMSREDSFLPSLKRFFFWFKFTDTWIRLSLILMTRMIVITLIHITIIVIICVATLVIISAWKYGWLHIFYNIYYVSLYLSVHLTLNRRDAGNSLSHGLVNTWSLAVTF